ncbi:M15 family metallopeptidase [Candidatus Viridilinea mediisalina]|uniref:Peptidase M15C domain-containing protein n=1 Tax=Candidatus Viridilinea mediisalina TaxID=2024553 RepID=A0A2A6RDK4_9CHLR|nr:M15 family metallopeptidase [Candidatus Viridilinea mediisalina]PDV99642.1 hypothetical protein CJ255_21330 [Candidatus Viridilinea mediisalina]
MSNAGRVVRLVVVVDDRRTGAAALAAFETQATPLPHYYVGQDGQVQRLLADQRCGTYLANVIYQQRRRNLNPIALAVALERPEHAEYRDAQLLAVDGLVAQVLEQHQLGLEALATIMADAQGRLRLYPYLPPPPPLPWLVTPDQAQVVLGSGAASETDLFVALFGESYKPLGGSLNLRQAFPLHAAQKNLGAPIGRNAPPPVVVNGRSFNLQPYARDTLFNEGTDYAAVQQLSALFDPASNGIPAQGLGRELLAATYRMALEGVQAAGVPLQGRTTLEPGWRFHQVARHAGYGPPLSGNYRSPDQRYALQVFAAETLYTPVTELSGCRLLSSTEPSDPAYPILWQETYKVARAPYQPDDPLHRRALELRLGAPLTGPYQVQLLNTNYRVQVWALDTLYQGPDGQIRRMSELPKPTTVVNWQPRAPRQAPPPTPSNPLPPVAAGSEVGPPRPGDINWPARPNFNIITDTNGVRPRLLGNLQWRPAQGTFITITNNWPQQHVVDVNIPQLLQIPGVRSPILKFHRIAAEQLRSLFAAWEAAGLMHLIKTFDGAWVPRLIRLNPGVLSNHAYGTAFDINARWNGMLKIAAFVGQPGSVRELVPLANAHGFYWGGHWNFDGKGASDGMHFEWARPM